ncbi:MAG: carboxylating nicotinate-nucleotide diphosphorylase [Clostridiaceae bacterium]|nr:carboxylating nicotinate-nucleotide diphosphorylase [Clostridiaceae bacterium]
MLNWLIVDKIIKNALEEDMPYGDITTDLIIGSVHGSKNPVNNARAEFIVKEDGVIAGLDVAARVFELLDGEVLFTRLAKDGSYVQKGTVIAEITGHTATLLKGERTALNILQRMSGIATKTREFCKRVEGTGVQVADTRKTTPGMRMLEKYAVRMGGGSNHRYSLSDGVLIKDNHIKAAGSIKEAVKRVRKSIPHTIKIEVETETLEQVKEALEAGADIIMLDNMDIETMKKAVDITGGKAVIEASGNMSLEKVYDVALTGVNIISVGSLTHSVKALDISMKIKGN